MNLFLKHKFLIAGIGLGAVLGYVYYYFWGCSNGCTITSSPVNSTIYGAAMGGLFLSLFQKEKQAKNNNNL